MSGNFVQRGDIAVFAKHARAAAAVRCGADLVLELPLPYALSSAERFAVGGVRLLDALGVVTHLSFGSEAGELGGLREAADCLRTGEASERIRAELETGAPYAAARYLAARRRWCP
jgi:predicted nucleotidyltransferase